MRTAFGSDADLSRLGPGGAEVSEVSQQATLDVDANGTEATAATKIGLEDSAEAPSHPLVIDHPYLFLIRDTKTGAILFTAAVQDPTTS